MTTRSKLTGHARRTICAAAFALMSAPAYAATITVNNLYDTTGGPYCTLRDAITAANTDSPAGGCAAGSGADMIEFDYWGTINLTSVLIVEADSELTLRSRMGPVTLSGQHAVQVLQVHGTLRLEGLNVVDGNAFHGGGIGNFGTLTAIDCTFSGNSGVFGGAIHNRGVLAISNSTFTGNGALWGGAIQNNASGTATVSNSTVSGNTGDSVGGINNDGTISVLNSTIYGNASIGLRNSGTGVLNLRNTIVANSGRLDCENLYGPVNASGNNLIGSTEGPCPSTHTGDPRLGPLANNGGRTLTHALLPGSPAIDAGDSTACATLPRDQRHYLRSVDGDRDGSAVCDLGAYESAPLFAFSGFFAPVDNLPTINEVKAGRAVPVKFSLDGYQGLNIFAANFPSSQRITCDSGAPVSDVEETVAAGGSALSYDEATDTYTYVWKTDKAWSGTCRQLIVQLADGTFHLASFRLK
jgi:hypothetical protein